MQVQAENEPYDDINITPMLDLAYVLLVTFIILTTASIQGVRVESPKTVAGLFVAIPALFGYNYLLIRNKNVTANMQVFVDEFVTRLAEQQRVNQPAAVAA